MNVVHQIIWGDIFSEKKPDPVIPRSPRSTSFQPNGFKSRWQSLSLLLKYAFVELKHCISDSGKGTMWGDISALAPEVEVCRIWTSLGDIMLSWLKEAFIHKLIKTQRGLWWPRTTIQIQPISLKKRIGKSIFQFIHSWTYNMCAYNISTCVRTIAANVTYRIVPS